MPFYILLIFSFLLSLDSDNIYNIISSPRNNAMGGIHASHNSVSNIFDTPVNINVNDKHLFLSLNNFNDFLTIYHVGYCLYSNNNMNLSLGLVRREIYDNYNTQQAWNYDGYPELEEIDYNMISSFSDKQTGLLLAYNHIFNKKNILGINFKTEFHKIGNITAFGYSMDLRYLANLNKFDYSIGLNNILSQKIWETGLIEKNKISGYFNISIDLFRSIVLFSEYNTESNFILGSEIKFLDIFSLRFGTNDIEDFSFGVGLILKNISLDYTYKENSNNILGNNHILGFILDLKKF